MNKLFQTLLTHFEEQLQHNTAMLSFPSTRIREAILYTLAPGGKRIRPLLVYLTGQTLGVSQELLDIIATSIEYTHTYSLIHDDLPAMDNDDWRRGKPSCHRAFDEATAILAGDALQVLAIDVLLTHLSRFIAQDKVIAITQALIKASGPQGMISGQCLDMLELGQATLQESRLREIHQLKTGQLFSACINMVLHSTHASHNESQALRNFADYFGLVFQMQDDYLDEYSSIHQDTKKRASDAANQKTTYASLYTQQELYEKIQDVFQQAKKALEPLSNKEGLCILLDMIEERSKP